MWTPNETVSMEQREEIQEFKKVKESSLLEFRGRRKE